MYEAIHFIAENKINEKECIQDCLEKDALGNKYSFYDPYSLSIQIIDKSAVKKRTEESINKKKNKIIENNISSYKYPLDVYRDILLDLKKNKINKIRRQYPKSSKSTNIYNSLQREEFYNKIKKIYCNLPDLYNKFIGINFPQYIKELNYYNGFDIAIMMVNLKDYYDEYESPLATIFYLKAKTKSNNFFTILEDDLNQKRYEFDIDYIFNGISYRVCCKKNISLDVLYSDFPILELLYSTLGDRLKNIEPKLF